MIEIFGNRGIFGGELILSLLIIFMCFFIYIRTRDAFKLTKHKGIEYFRKTFLFFGIAYLFRFLMRLTLIGGWLCPCKIPFHYLGLISLILVSYVSTVAILFLFYSFTWKELKGRYNCLLIHIISLIIAILAVLFREPLILILVHGIILIMALLFGYFPHKKKTMLIIYSLLVVFWIIGLVPLTGSIVFFPKIMHFSHILSIGVLVLIYFKIRKWLK